MFNESLGLIRRLWTEDEVSHEGRFYSCANITVRPRPVQSPPEVWLGGIAPSELRRVGRLADGWLPSFVTPEGASAAKEVVEAAAKDADRQIDPEHFGVLVLYSSGAPLSGDLVERLKKRQPDLDLSTIVPVGLKQTAELLERFVDAGFSKFVLLPTEAKADMTAELEAVASEILPMEN
jgi:probable F420-dependent oxidoreductase